MKFTSEMLMEAMGLAVGDRVKAPNGVIYEVVSEVVDSANVIGLINKGKYEDNYFPLKMLVCDEDFEILPKPKRVGDTNGDNYENCINCPLRLFDYCGNYCDGNLSLYEVLEQSTKYVKRKGLFDQEIYDLLKNRLDKEVVEE